ncbi:MAG: sulfatase [Prosthecobacter sp.]|uniref:sulfatase family protein n=1 Tax=Prosthecobacter sp. TaxID=1965333 RepID=UPI0038FE23FF
MKQTIPLLAALLLAPLLGLAAAEPAKPNIVLIFIDDLGYADIGPFGNSKVRTPHLDKLATEGMKFTSFYATPVCSMSRACLMTGCYNARVSIPGVLFPKDTIGLHPNEVTLAEIVKQKGYATCCIGKWHLGWQPEFLPTRQGFDHYFGLPYSNDMGAGNRGRGLPPLPLIKGDKVIETEPDQSQLTRRYTEDAVGFIREHKAAPFFVYLPHTMVHHPLASSAAFSGKSQQGDLGDAIEEVDWSVGQILATLQELKLDDNTLVIFTSDNGPASGRAAPPYRGSKGSNFEGGVREPCIMRWPGKIPAGTTCNQIAGNIDILPTFAKLIGVEPVKDRVLDGRDITTLMFNANAGPVRDTHLYIGGDKAAAIRQGDWKLFLKGDGADKKTKKAAGTKTKPPKGGPVPSLYNLATDPGETQNVAAANPEIVARLKKELLARDAEIQANKRPAGQAEGTK